MIIIVSSAEERRNRMMDIIQEKKKVKVADLKSTFNVSGVTIGADLDHLEKKGFIEKKFGYAQYKDNGVSFINAMDTKNYAEKKKIGKAASKYICSHESILIYTGSTGLHVAKHIGNVKNLIAVTNCTQIAHELALNPGIRTILLGGFYNPENFSSYGGQTIKQMSEYNIDKVILSINGVSAEDGITIDQPFETELNIAFLKNAKTRIVVADHSKIGVSRFIKIAPLDEIHILITDDKAPEEELEKIRKLGVEVVIA